MSKLRVNEKPPLLLQRTGEAVKDALDKEGLWSRTLARLRDRMNAQSFSTWFEPLSALELKENTFTLLAPNSFVSDWVITNYLDLLEELLSMEAGAKVAAKVISKSEKSPAPTVVATIPRPKSSLQRNAKSAPLPKTYREFTFERFVCGANNKFAFAAAQAVCEFPGERYNPLFIVAATGQGKTHLASAIALKMHHKNPNLRISFISSEGFVNEYINAMRAGKMDEFHYRFRLATDILIIDDVQFFCGKTQSQEELFHTFNALYQHRKQIIMTSDKFPDEMGNIDERLKTRFQWGVVADIHPPEIETKVAILRERSTRLNILPDDKILFYIAENTDGCVRELEGLLNTLYARASLLGKPLTLSLAEEVLTTLPRKPPRKNLSFEAIARAVAANFGLKVSDLTSERRHKTLIIPRYIAMLLCREHLGASYPEIGRYFGNRDHRSVMNALKSLEKRMTADETLKKQLKDIEKLLR